MERAGGRAILDALISWFDTSRSSQAAELDGDGDRVEWVRCLPFLLSHLACLAVFWVGASAVAVGAAAALYVVRLFAITAFYHRYFSHRAYKTSRPAQLVFALLGNSSGQRGPLWWAAHHRHHHRHTDTERDRHSPRQHGFVRSHVGWFLTPNGFRTDTDLVADLAAYPELRFLDRFDALVPILLGVAVFATGELLAAARPELGTDGPQLLVWGYFVSTVLVAHGTFTINSLAHQMGRRAYATDDDSRNSLLLSLITLGEGWHNNHHRYPGAARQGFRWWQLDITFYGLWLLERLGVIWDLRPVPERVRVEAKAARPRSSAAC